MKKLMIAAAVVCAAVMAQASSIAWGSGGVVLATDWDEYYNMADNCAIYFFDASVDKATLVSELAGGDFSGLANASASEVVYEGAFTPSAKIASAVAAGNNVNYYAILFDAANAEDAGYFFATQTYTESMPATETLDCQWDGDTNILALDYDTKENWTQVAPEPTSGLLLLIGVAGLALRRRRA